MTTYPDELCALAAEAEQAKERFELACSRYHAAGLPRTEEFLDRAIACKRSVRADNLLADALNKYMAEVGL